MRDIDLALHLPLRYEDETRITLLKNVTRGRHRADEATVTDCGGCNCAPGGCSKSRLMMERQLPADVFSLPAQKKSHGRHALAHSAARSRGLWGGKCCNPTHKKPERALPCTHPGFTLWPSGLRRRLISAAPWPVRCGGGEIAGNITRATHRRLFLTIGMEMP